MTVARFLYLEILTNIMKLSVLLNLFSFTLITYFSQIRADVLATATNCGTYSPQTDTEVVCHKCEPGHFVRHHCNATHKTVCEVCPQGQYNSDCSQASICADCDLTCDPLYGEIAKKQCTIVNNLRCGCPDGEYRKNSEYDRCKKHTPCEAGYGVSKSGTENSDTECVKCPHGTFSPLANNLKEPCKSWTECSGPVLTQASPGNATHDRTCSGIIEDTTTERGGDDEIIVETMLPAKIAGPICGVIVLCLIASVVGYLWRRRNRSGHACRAKLCDGDELSNVGIPTIKKDGNDDFRKCASYVAQNVIGREYHFFLRELGLRDACIEQMDVMYARDVFEVVYQGILKFRNKFPEQAVTPEILLKTASRLVKNKQSRKALEYLAHEFSVDL